MMRVVTSSEVSSATGVNGPEDENAANAGAAYVFVRNGTTWSQQAYSIFVSYYDEQRQGKSIHSPKNCLPGAGWEPVESKAVVLETTAGPVTVNRWLLVREGKSAIVYYWYQGRGRVAHDEFRVKYDLLRDAAVHGRTEEALVRIFVQVDSRDVAAADAVARAAAMPLVADVNRILPPL